MKPTSLVLSGWGPYRGVEQADFETMQQGLFLVSGPTGSGKTTIFDGITFALYGEVSGSIREKDSLQRENSDIPGYFPDSDLRYDDGASVGQSEGVKRPD